MNKEESRGRGLDKEIHSSNLKLTDSEESKLILKDAWKTLLHRVPQAKGDRREIDRLDRRARNHVKRIREMRGVEG